MQNKKVIFLTVVTVIITLLLGAFLGRTYTLSESGEVVSPFISQENKKALPLLRYSIPNLAKHNYKADQEIVLEDIISEEKNYTSYLFSYTTMDKKMTGMLNIPNASDASNPNKYFPVIVMLRGWVPAKTYTSGIGTKNAAAIFAKNGYVTIAPDFFGYGESDTEPKNSWEARFIKPINVIELIKTISEFPKISLLEEESNDKKIQLDPTKIGFWAHSNGGQIALSSLEILSQTSILEQPIPTTLWAPVTTPFPYSVLFFSDEVEDEGKASRKWISIFEDDYDVFDFSLTQHLDKLTGPIQLHHGSADDAALKAWSDEFVVKIEAENKRRGKIDSKEETNETMILDHIEIKYFSYPGADHNLQPSWDTAVQRDLQFFEKNL